MRNPCLLSAILAVVALGASSGYPDDEPFVWYKVYEWRKLLRKQEHMRLMCSAGSVFVLSRNGLLDAELSYLGVEYLHQQYLGILESRRGGLESTMTASEARDRRFMFQKLHQAVESNVERFPVRWTTDSGLDAEDSAVIEASYRSLVDTLKSTMGGSCATYAGESAQEWGDRLNQISTTIGYFALIVGNKEDVTALVQAALAGITEAFGGHHGESGRRHGPFETIAEVQRKKLCDIERSIGIKGLADGGKEDARLIRSLLLPKRDRAASWGGDATTSSASSGAKLRSVSFDVADFATKQWNRLTGNF